MGAERPSFSPRLVLRESDRKRRRCETEALDTPRLTKVHRQHAPFRTYGPLPRHSRIHAPRPHAWHDGLGQYVLTRELRRPSLFNSLESLRPKLLPPSLGRPPVPRRPLAYRREAEFYAFGTWLRRESVALAFA
jgi:hypothetical protein